MNLLPSCTKAILMTLGLYAVPIECGVSSEINHDEIVAISLPTSPVDSLVFAINYKGKTLNFTLSKDKNKGEGFHASLQQSDGPSSELPLNTEELYTGTISELEGSSVKATLVKNGLIATISRVDLPSLIIAPSIDSSGITLVDVNGSKLHEIKEEFFGSKECGCLSHETESHLFDGISVHDLYQLETEIKYRGESVMVTEIGPVKTKLQRLDGAFISVPNEDLIHLAVHGSFEE